MIKKSLKIIENQWKIIKNLWFSSIYVGFCDVSLFPNFWWSRNDKNISISKILSAKCFLMVVISLFFMRVDWYDLWAICVKDFADGG